MRILYVIFSLLMGYLIGGINAAYLIGRVKGIDIRKKGSGNAGASNAAVVMGRGVGAFAAVFDIAKAFAAVKLAALFFPTLAVAGVLGGTACILGHIFPVFMGFRGGKGLACLAGVALALDWKVFFILLALEAVLVLVVDYICVVPMTGTVLFTIAYAWRTHSLVGALAFAVVSVVILCKHRINIERIRNKEEIPFSYLWTKKKKK